MKATFALLLILLGSVSLAGGEGLGEAFGTEILPEWRFEEARQYDFWLGEWDGNWRARDGETVFFQKEGRHATHWLYPILDGKAIIELVRGDEPNDDRFRTRGFSVRYYDPTKELWVMAQNWPGPNQGVGFLDQLQGAERHGRIEVFSTFKRSSDDLLVTRRYAFSDIGKGRFRWDDLYTGDGGLNWRRGQVVDFTRTVEEARWPEVGQPMPGFDDGAHCTMEPFRRFHFLEGRWTGTVEGAGSTRSASLTATRIEDGCAVMSVLAYERDDEPYKLFEARSYGPNSEAHFVYRLDNRKETPHSYQVGGFDDAGHLVLATNPALVIRDALTVIESDPAIPERPLERTVWTRLDEGAIAFEMQRRESAGGSWETTESFTLSRER